MCVVSIPTPITVGLYYTPEPPNLATAAEFYVLAENQPKKIRLSLMASVALAAEKYVAFEFHISSIQLN